MLDYLPLLVIVGFIVYNCFKRVRSITQEERRRESEFKAASKRNHPHTDD